jgi:hypothetical protein
VGHVKRGYEDWVCLLQRSIYGLRLSPRNWNSTLHLALVEFGFCICFKDEALYWIRVDSRLVLLPIYVDDILLIGVEEDVDFIVEKLKARFDMKELGTVNYLLGLQITYEPEKRVCFQQSKYVHDIMQKFNMDTAYPVSSPMATDAVKLQPASEDEHKRDQCLPYRSLVGCLQYLVSDSRLDLATAMRMLSRFLETYSAVPWRAAKRVLRYLIAVITWGCSTIWWKLESTRISTSRSSPTPTLLQKDEFEVRQWLYGVLQWSTNFRKELEAGNPCRKHM